MKSALLVAVMALVTALLRFLPFLLFRKKVPSPILYLGQVLPPSILGMLVIYCLRDVSLLSFPFGLPELIASASTVLLQLFRRNTLLSILFGTLLYMVLTQFVF